MSESLQLSELLGKNPLSGELWWRKRLLHVQLPRQPLLSFQRLPEKITEGSLRIRGVKQRLGV